VSEHERAEQAQRTPVAPPAADAAAPAPVASRVLGLQRAAGNAAVTQYLQGAGLLSAPGDAQEREADAVARAVMEPGTATPSIARAPEAKGEVDVSALGPGQPLARAVRDFMEPRFGTGFGDVRVHTDQAAARASAALGAEAFTYGSDVYYGAGKAPSNDELTAHELSHVVQQRAGVARKIQRTLAASHAVTNGVFEVDMQTREGAVNTPATMSGLDGYIRFVPNSDAPNSNKIVFIQIVKLTDAGGADVNPVSMPAAQAPRGGLGDPGVRTEDNEDTGVEGGFFTDVHHRPNSASPGAAPGSPLSPNYNFQPAAPGTTGVVGQTQQPAQYGGGTGGVVGQTPGFKRSSDAADIRSSALYDTPGTTSATSNLNFDFESVARGEDTMVTYGSVKWGFKLRAGKVSDEYLNAVDAASATFDEALERHRDFYVHEPVTFYFAFNAKTLDATETAKIDTFLDYLTRNPTVKMQITGFADVQGGASKYNLDLSFDRASAVEKALLAKGVDASRIDPIVIGQGASASATADAGTGDQGGDPAVGADQTREANRWANRRVVVEFVDTPAGP
jgi:outer membrane protein OmpA-like peptidoglycan-associated protein